MVVIISSFKNHRTFTAILKNGGGLDITWLTSLTSELSIGDQFDAEQFVSPFKDASVRVFAACHHGYLLLPFGYNTGI
jgi:hypothetical protein